MGLTIHSSEEEVNAQVQEALALCPGIVESDIDQCVATCILALKESQLLQYAPWELIVNIASATIAYLGYTGVPAKRVAFSVTTLLSEVVKTLTSDPIEVRTLPTTGKAYKLCKREFERAYTLLDKTRQGTRPLTPRDNSQDGVQAASISQDSQDGVQAASISQDSQDGVQAASISQDSQDSQDGVQTPRTARKGRIKKSILVKESSQDTETVTEENKPPDLERVNGSIDLYVSVSTGKAYVKRGSVKVTYKEVFSVLPEKVVKLHATGAYKGQATQYRMTLQGQTETFTFDDLRYGKWSELYKNKLGVSNVPANSQYAQIIDHLVNLDEIENNYLQTGLHHIEGVYFYVFPNNVIATNGAVPSTPINFAHKPRDIETLETWDAWFQAASKQDVNAMIDAVNYCVGLTPIKGQGIIELCHHVRTLSRSIRSGSFRTGYMLYVFGKATSGKTSLTCFTANVAKPSSYDGGYEHNYRGTKTSIEKIIDSYGDTPFIIDDFEPGDSLADKKAGESLLTALAKSSYDGTAIRPRQNGDMSDKKSNFVYTFPTTTSVFYPSDLSEGALRRILFIEIVRGSIPLQEGAFNLKTAHDVHKDGLAMVGYAVIMLHLSNLNTRGLQAYIDERVTRVQEYKASINTLVNALWKEHNYGDVPGIADNLLTIAANITLGAYDVDAVTQGACNLVDKIKAPLARIVFEQLLLLEGIRRVNGESLLDESIRELFTSITENTPVNNRFYRVSGYRKNEEDELKISLVIQGEKYQVPSEQWGDSTLPNGTSKLIAAYVDYREECLQEAILYLTKAGRDALLHIAKNTEGLEHIKTQTALAKLLDREAWIIKRNGTKLGVPCNPQSTKIQIRCLALSFERVLNQVFDTESFIAAQTPIKPKVTPNSFTPPDMKEFIQKTSIGDKLKESIKKPGSKKEGEK